MKRHNPYVSVKIFPIDRKYAIKLKEKISLLGPNVKKCCPQISTALKKNLLSGANLFE